MDSMRQVVVIHGGGTFDTHEEYLAWLNAYEISLEKTQTERWKTTLDDALGEDYEVIQPRMPNAFDAQYPEWKLWFEKYLALLGDDLILVGHSLGAIFLAKYLSEETVSKHILGTFLIAAPFDSADVEYSLSDFALPESLSKCAEQSRVIHFYHSTDDEVVPFTDLAKYQKVLPYARATIFGDKGHFSMEEFPELVADIKALG